MAIWPQNPFLPQKQPKKAQKQPKKAIFSPKKPFFVATFVLQIWPQSGQMATKIAKNDQANFTGQIKSGHGQKKWPQKWAII